MANRFFNNAMYSMEKAPVFLFAKVAIGATGAPTLGRAKGVKSITRSSAGKYVVTLSDTYVAMLDAHCTRMLASGLPAAPAFNLVSESVATDGKITVQFAGATAAGDTTLVAADPSDGTTLYFQFVLSNSSAT